MSLSKTRLLIAFLITFLAYSTFAQESEETTYNFDCTIPIEAQNLKPGGEGVRVLVQVGFFVIDIKEIDDLEQTYTADIWFTETWHDPRLSEKALGKSLEKCFLG